MLGDWGIFALGAGSGAAVCALAFLLTFNRYLPGAPRRSKQVGDASSWSRFAEGMRDEETVQK